MAKAGFGGGCHWCTEGVFQALRGVAQVEQGFVQSDPPADVWSEGVIVTFDPSVIPLATLCEVHLRTHSATRARSPRSKYRSAIYIFEDSQRPEAEQAIIGFGDASGKPVQTLVLPFREFKPLTSATGITIAPTRADPSAGATSIPSWISSDDTFQRWRSRKRIRSPCRASTVVGRRRSRAAMRRRPTVLLL